MKRPLYVSLCSVVLVTTACHLPNGRPVFYGNLDIHQIPNPVSAALEDAFQGPDETQGPGYWGTVRTHPQKSHTEGYCSEKEQITNASHPQFSEILDLLSRGKISRAERKYAAIEDRLSTKLREQYQRAIEKGSNIDRSGRHW